MLKLKLIPLLLLLATALQAQTPNRINYQAVARNASGVPVTNTTIKVRFTFTNALQTIVWYRENHTVNTGATGLYSLVIGNGNIEAGSMAIVPWSTVSIKAYTEYDLDNNGSYEINEFKDMLSVPYALNAETANSADGLTNYYEILSNTQQSSQTKNDYVANAGTTFTVPRSGLYRWDLHGIAGWTPALGETAYVRLYNVTTSQAIGLVFLGYANSTNYADMVNSGFGYASLNQNDVIRIETMVVSNNPASTWLFGRYNCCGKPLSSYANLMRVD